MIPLRALATTTMIFEPPIISRYNDTEAISVIANPAPGVSSGDALTAMARSRSARCRRDSTMNGPARRIWRIRAAGQTGPILVLSVLFAYLFLVALYESWVIPVPVLLSVVIGVFGALFGCGFAGWKLICTCRSAWSRDRVGGEERHPDCGIREGTPRGRDGNRRGRRHGGADAVPRGDDDLDCVHLRADPARGGNGSAQISRRSLGTPVFAGMIAASLRGDFCHSAVVCRVSGGEGEGWGLGRR